MVHPSANNLEKNIHKSCGRVFFSDGSEGDKLLLVQCDSGDVNQNLIKCAQYCVQDQMPVDATCFHVVFIIQLPRIAGGCFTGFQVSRMVMITCFLVVIFIISVRLAS